MLTQSLFLDRVMLVRLRLETPKENEGAGQNVLSCVGREERKKISWGTSGEARGEAGWGRRREMRRVAEGEWRGN
jgi:hypothetical protein